ncbi:hypothetical protein PT276_06610 [Orbaceae bacterium ESL0721]|nr:hypothetical protein [Orbaceae bacterium ESL0721]
MVISQMAAGHDINLAAGQVVNQSDKNSSGKITLTAKNDTTNLIALKQQNKQSIHTSKNNYRKSDIKEQVVERGSTIQGGKIMATNIAINAVKTTNDIKEQVGNKVMGSDIKVNR